MLSSLVKLISGKLPTKQDKATTVAALGLLAILGLWLLRQSPNYETEPKVNKAFGNLPDTSSINTQRDESPSKENVDLEKTPKEIWKANDYKPGDVSAGMYTVKSGDTLWELAEAVYGNGSYWTKILQTNIDQIGYLPNGQQALIFPGQVLQLPSS